MWWQILPSAAIIGTFIYLPQVIAYVAHSVCYGTPYMRYINKKYEGHMILRDFRLTGNIYKQNMLDSLDDDDDTEKATQN